MMLKYALAALLGFAVTYLAFAFIAWEFDVRAWDVGGRLLFVWLGSSLATIFCAFCAASGEPFGVKK